MLILQKFIIKFQLKALNSAININNCQLISKTAKELAVVAKINKDSSVLIDKAAEYLKLAVDKTTNDVSFDKIVFICTSCENSTWLIRWSQPVIGKWKSTPLSKFYLVSYIRERKNTVMQSLQPSWAIIF